MKTEIRADNEISSSVDKNVLQRSERNAYCELVPKPNNANPATETKTKHTSFV